MKKENMKVIFLLPGKKTQSWNWKDLAGNCKKKKKKKIDIIKQIEDRKKELLDIEEKLSALNSLIIRKGEGEQIAVRKELESIRGEISRCMSTIELAENEINDIDSQKRKAFLDVDTVQGKIMEFDAKLKEETRRNETIKGEVSDKNTQLLILKSKISEVDAKFVETRDRLSAAKLGLETVKNEKNELMREEDRLLDAARRKSSESRDREL